MSGIFSKMHFWCQARNRHGIHSPFIYDFLDRGVYSPQVKQVPHKQKLLRATRVHFNPKRIWISPGLHTDSAIRRDLNPGPTLQNPPFDLFVFEKPAPGAHEVLCDATVWHNDSIVYIGNLRVSDATHAAWRDISGHPSVRVALETYWEGLLFFRKEQAQQHFKIRT